MKRNYLLYLLVWAGCLQLPAQTGSITGDNQNIRDLAAPDNTMTVQTYDNRYQGVKGHPYLFQDWKTGDIITNKGSRITGVKLKYDVYRDELSLQKDSDAEVITLFNEHVSSFEIGIKSFRMVGNSEGNHFYEVLVNGKSDLLARRHKILRKANYEGVYSADQPFDQFLTTDSKYYLQLNNGELVPVKGTVKSLAAALGVNDKELRKEIKANGFDIKSEMDLINLVALYTADTPDLGN